MGRVQRQARALASGLPGTNCTWPCGPSVRTRPRRHRAGDLHVAPEWPKAGRVTSFVSFGPLLGWPLALQDPGHWPRAGARRGVLGWLGGTPAPPRPGSVGTRASRRPAPRTQRQEGPPPGRATWPGARPTGGRHPTGNSSHTPANPAARAIAGGGAGPWAGETKPRRPAASGTQEPRRCERAGEAGGAVAGPGRGSAGRGVGGQSAAVRAGCRVRECEAKVPAGSERPAGRGPCRSGAGWPRPGPRRCRGAAPASRSAASGCRRLWAAPSCGPEFRFRRGFRVQPRLRVPRGPRSPAARFAGGAQPRLLLPGEAAGAGFEPWTVLPRAGERQGLTAGGGGQTRGPVPRPGTEMKSDVANDGRVLIS